MFLLIFRSNTLKHLSFGVLKSTQYYFCRIFETLYYGLRQQYIVIRAHIPVTSCTRTRRISRTTAISEECGGDEENVDVVLLRCDIFGPFCFQSARQSRCFLSYIPENYLRWVDNAWRGSPPTNAKRRDDASSQVALIVSATCAREGACYIAGSHARPIKGALLPLGAIKGETIKSRYAERREKVYLPFPCAINLTPSGKQRASFAIEISARFNPAWCTARFETASLARTQCRFITSEEIHLYSEYILSNLVQS